jgi:UDP:flavonoid glycosyltransferase YjiC (YdhE family)
MRVLLATVGSRGDVQPMAALARGLIARGHEVALAAPPGNEGWAKRAGATYFELGRDIQAFLDQKMADGMKPILAGLAVRKLLLEDMPKQVDQLVAAAEAFRPDLVGMASLALAATTAAERVGAKTAWLAYSPTMFPSDDHAPGLVPMADKPRLVNRGSWALFFALFRRWFEKPINRRRADLGMAPLGPGEVVPSYALSAWDEPLAGVHEVERDFGRPLVVERPTGHLEFDFGDAGLPEPVARFLDEGEAPVYVGFGSMPDLKPAETLRAVAEVGRELGRRVIVLTGWTRRVEVELPEGVLVAERAPHAALFPRCAAIVHHGGAGTTAAAARAGRPQVIVPHIVDQYDWASRLHRRGLAPRGLPKARLNARRLRAAVEEALGDRIQERAAEVADELRQVDGVASACDALEEIARA